MVINPCTAPEAFLITTIAQQVRRVITIIQKMRWSPPLLPPRRREAGSADVVSPPTQTVGGDGGTAATRARVRARAHEEAEREMRLRLAWEQLVQRPQFPSMRSVSNVGRKRRGSVDVSFMCAAV